MSWLDNVFSNELSEDGTPVPQRKRVDFVGATVEDVPAEDLTRVTITGGGGVELSDSPARGVAADSAPGTGAKASRADHVHAHGDQPGGSLHALAVPSVAGVGGSAGFQSPADAEAVAALPTTLADYVLQTEVDTAATANKVVRRDGSGNGTFSGLVSSSLSHASADLAISASGAGKAVVINGAGGAFLRHNGANIAATTASSFLLFRSAVFDGSFNGTFGFLAAGSTPGKTVTLAGQSVTTGTGGAAIVQAGTGSVASGEVQLSGDVIRGLSNEFAWMSVDTYTKVLANSTDGITLAGKGIKLQVNDSVTPATVRTPLEIVREATGVGTVDAILVNGSLVASSASDPGKTMKWLASGDFSLSTESVNADGRRSLDHGADGASLYNSSLAVAPKTWTASGGTLTIDCSMSNVHKVTVTANTTIALTDTRAGAHYTFDFTGGATGGDITLTPGTSFVRMDVLGSIDPLSIGAGGSGGRGFVFGYATSDGGPVRIIHMDSVPTG